MSENKILEWLKEPLAIETLDEMAQRHFDATNSNQRLFNNGLESTESIASIAESLADIPRLIIEVRRAQLALEKKKPAEAGSVLRDYPIG